MFSFKVRIMMREAIFSLVGVLLGGVITFVSTFFFEWKNRKYEEKRKEKELICNVIKQYEILSDKIYFNEYYQDDPQDIIKYISEEFMNIRRDNRNEELLFIKNDLIHNIEKADNSIFSFDQAYDGKELIKVKSDIKECIAVLKEYIV